METLKCENAKKDGSNLSLLPATFLNKSAEDPDLQMVMSKGLWSNLTEIVLKIEPFRCLQTGGSMKVLELTTEAGYYISTSGDLVSFEGEFDPSLDMGDFCIDFGEKVSGECHLHS